MPRYQVGYSVLERANLTETELARALKQSDACNVRLRYQWGWSNQPRTPTFAADSEWEARQVLRAALDSLGLDVYPSCYDIAGE